MTETQDINPGDYAIDTCQWCRGSGKDGATLGMPIVRDCPRCLGSGKVYVTSKESVTGRRRVFKGPVPKPVQVVVQQETTQTPKPATQTIPEPPKAKRKYTRRA